MKLLTANKISLAVIAGVFALNYCMPANAKSGAYIDSDIVSVNINNSHTILASDMRTNCIKTKTVVSSLKDERTAYSYAFNKVAYGMSESLDGFLIGAQASMHLCKNLNRNDTSNIVAMAKGVVAGQGYFTPADHIEVNKKNGSVLVIFDNDNDYRPYRMRQLDQDIAIREQKVNEANLSEERKQYEAKLEKVRLQERNNACKELKEEIDGFNKVALYLIKDKQWDYKKLKMQYAKSCGSNTSIESGEDLNLQDYINSAKADK